MIVNHNAVSLRLSFHSVLFGRPNIRWLEGHEAAVSHKSETMPLLSRSGGGLGAVHVGDSSPRLSPSVSVNLKKKGSIDGGTVLMPSLASSLRVSKSAFRW